MLGCSSGRCCTVVGLAEKALPDASQAMRRIIAVASLHAGETSTALQHPPPRLQLHDPLLSGRALYRVDQLVARHSEIEVHLESGTRSEGVCRAPIGLDNIAWRAGRRALGDEGVLGRNRHLGQRGVPFGSV